MERVGGLLEATQLVRAQCKGSDHGMSPGGQSPEPLYRRAE